MILEQILTKGIDKLILSTFLRTISFFNLSLLFYNLAIRNERIEIEALTINEIVE